MKNILIQKYVNKCYYNLKKKIGKEDYFIELYNHTINIVFSKKTPNINQNVREYVIVYFENNYYNVISIDNDMGRINSHIRTTDIYNATYEILKSYVYEITEKSYNEDINFKYEDFVKRQIDFFSIMDLNLKKYCIDDYIRKLKKMGMDYSFLT